MTLAALPVRLVKITCTYGHVAAGGGFGRGHCNAWDNVNGAVGQLGARARPVVPADSTAAIVFAIYSHGDRHATTRPVDGAGGHEGSGSRTTAASAHEWYAHCNGVDRGDLATPSYGRVWQNRYAHFPYETKRAELYEMVATEQAPSKACGGFGRYLYGTQLRQIFHQLFERQPRRPVVGLLNYCLSGGNLVSGSPAYATSTCAPPTAALLSPAALLLARLEWVPVRDGTV